MKILTVIGARPQFIKAAPVSKALAEQGIDEVLLHTGQHFDANMSDVFFSELKIPRPDVMLDIHSGGHGAMTGRMLEAIEQSLIEHQPDMVLVYGDTNSTLAGALAAVKLHIPLAHIEAGLRSFNMSMPEEVNRILTDRISTILLCPTDTAVGNLKTENVPGRVVKTGDVMADTLAFFKPKAVKPDGVPDADFILCTCHRAENTDDPDRMAQIVSALNTLHQDIPVILPLHPRTRKTIARLGLELNVNTLPPVGYFEMLWLLTHCGLVLTDSGGLQKEAYLMNTFCITLRDETEWVELVNSGVNALAGADADKIISLAKTHMGQVARTDTPLYGNGAAAQEIASEIADTLAGS